MQPPQPPSTPLPIPLQKSHTKLIIGVVSVVVVVIVIAAVLGFVWYPTTLQPKITMTDALYNTSGCGFFGPYYLVYTWTFDLTNTGTANGFATVTFYVNGNPVGTSQYYVPQGGTVSKSASVQGATQSGWPCPAETPDLAITAVTKA